MKSIATAGLVIISVLVFLDVLKKQNRLIGGLHIRRRHTKNLKSVRSLVAILIIVRTLSEHICLLNGERRLVYQ